MTTTTLVGNSTASWPVEELVAALQRPPGALPDDWWKWPQTREAYQRLSRAVVDSLLPSLNECDGRGIVICGGGDRLFANAFVCIKMLRHVGCRLPVQLWHLPNEVDDVMRELVAPLGVACIDASEVEARIRRKARILNGWELKPFAILGCPYEEVLLIDADNVPVMDPTRLFDARPYREAGAAFWPDFGRLDADREIWAICEVPFRDEPEFETGQILVNRRRCWRALWLTMHYNEHSDYYYRFVHGDKETFHMAFLRTETPFAMTSFGLHAISATMCQHDFAGRRIFQHRNMDKWRLDGQNQRVEDFWFEEACLNFLSELRKKWSGRPFWKLPEETARPFLSQ